MKENNIGAMVLPMEVETKINTVADSEVNNVVIILYNKDAFGHEIMFDDFQKQLKKFIGQKSIHIYLLEIAAKAPNSGPNSNFYKVNNSGLNTESPFLNMTCNRIDFSSAQGIRKALNIVYKLHKTQIVQYYLMVIDHGNGLAFLTPPTVKNSTSFNLNRRKRPVNDRKILKDHFWCFELHDAVKKSKIQNFRLAIFNSCRGATLDNCFLSSRCFDFLIASETSSNISGVPVELVLAEIMKMGIGDLCSDVQKLFEKLRKPFEDSFDILGVDPKSSLFCMNLSSFHQINNIHSQTAKILKRQINKNISILKEIRNRLQNINEENRVLDFVDFGEYIKQIILLAKPFLNAELMPLADKELLLLGKVSIANPITNPDPSVRNLPLLSGVSIIFQKFGGKKSPLILKKYERVIAMTRIPQMASWYNLLNLLSVPKKRLFRFKHLKPVLGKHKEKPGQFNSPGLNKIVV